MRQNPAAVSVFQHSRRRDAAAWAAMVIAAPFVLLMSVAAMLYVAVESIVKRIRG